MGLFAPCRHELLFCVGGVIFPIPEYSRDDRVGVPLSSDREAGSVGYDRQAPCPDIWLPFWHHKPHPKSNGLY